MIAEDLINSSDRVETNRPSSSIVSGDGKSIGIAESARPERENKTDNRDIMLKFKIKGSRSHDNYDAKSVLFRYNSAFESQIFHILSLVTLRLTPTSFNGSIPNPTSSTDVPTRKVHRRSSSRNSTYSSG